MFSWFLLLALPRAAEPSVEDLIRDLPRVRRGGRRRGFWGEVTKGVTNVGNTNGATNVGNTIGNGLSNAGQAIGNTWDGAVGAVLPGVFNCETKDEFTDCRDIATSNRNWMRQIPDHVKITELSIPGTHDSASLHGGAAPWHVICNSLTISKQLDAGIRYLDIRARHFNDALPIHHGQVFQNEYFSGVLRYVRQFLQQNPTETIFMRVKKEYNASGNTKSFDELQRYGLVAPGLGSSPYQLTMGQVRGKVVFMQDFGGNWLPGSVAWSSNTDYQGAVIQDDFEINFAWELNGKKSKIQQNLDQARNDPWRIYANHLSGTGASFGGTKQVAKPMNAHARQLFRSRSRGSGFGIIIADFPGKSLITDVINKNPFMNRAGRCGQILNANQCKKWATDHQLVFDAFKSQHAPSGCYQYYSNNANNLKVYFSKFGPKQCTNSRRCLCAN